MKKFLLILLSVASSTCYGQHSLKEIWASDTIMRVPESVLFDAEKNVLFVSQIDGVYNAKDGKGGVALLGTDGKVINNDWVRGLNAPKGMGKFKNTLYVADLTEVVVIDIPSAKVVKKIPVEGASFLNDITVNEKGDVFISDSDTGKVHIIQNGNVSTYLENFKRPNGLLALKSDLLILDSGSLMKADANKKLTKLAEGMQQSTDGIEQVKKGEYIVSCWAGHVYYVTKKGKVEELLNTNKDNINSADIGYDPKNKIIYIPTFFNNRVVAYQLK